mgnify:FL=1
MLKKDYSSISDRTYTVMNMLSKGFSKKSVHNYLEKTYGIAYRQRCRVIKEALEFMKEDTKASVEEFRALNNNRLDDLYEKTVKDKDYGNAIKTVDLVNKMNGVYTEEKSEESDKTIKIKFGD